jgi:alkylation response protein AidB-like acyl-CoA dehydrogenase
VTAAADVDRIVEELLAEHDPATTDFVAFRGAQYDRGLAWVHYPEGRGGLGLERSAQKEVDARLRTAGARPPEVVYTIGMQLMAPTVAAFGSPELQDRFLRRAFTCEDLWCQLFSEPGAGSDLASLATRAEPDGDQWVVNGQKVWTTMAHIARWGILVARTDPDVVKHKGLTFFVVDMQAPGVEVRPLRQITGDSEYNEVFLTDVRIPDANRVGDPGTGWTVTMTTLMNERTATEGLGSSRRGSGPIGRAVRLWQDLPPDRRTGGLRQELLRRWVEVEVARLTRLRASALRARGTPGAESSIGKISVARLQQQVLDLCTRLAGADAMLIDDYDWVQRESISQAPSDDLQVSKALLAVQATSIAGGTTEINKNLIAEQVLGLPREPAVDRSVPWSQLRRS